MKLVKLLKTRLTFLPVIEKKPVFEEEMQTTVLKKKHFLTSEFHSGCKNG